jgi:hypothetical protein
MVFDMLSAFAVSTVHAIKKNAEQQARNLIEPMTAMAL